MNSSASHADGFANSLGSPFVAIESVESAPVSFGYYNQDVIDAQDAAAFNRADRPHTIGWWQRHPVLSCAVGTALVMNLAFLPAVQNAVLAALT